MELPYADHNYAAQQKRLVAARPSIDSEFSSSNYSEVDGSSSYFIYDMTQQQNFYECRRPRGRPSMTLGEKFAADYNRGINGCVFLYALKIWVKINLIF